MVGFNIPSKRIGKSARKIIARAVKESRGRGHAILTNEHLLIAFAHVEWDTFSLAVSASRRNARLVLQQVDAHLNLIPKTPGRGLRPVPSVKLAFKRALRAARSSGRTTIESPDLLHAVFSVTKRLRTREAGRGVCDVARQGPKERGKRQSTRARIKRDHSRSPAARLLDDPCFLANCQYPLPRRSDERPPMSATLQYALEKMVADVNELADESGKLCRRLAHHRLKRVAEPGVRIMVRTLVYLGVPLIAIALLSAMTGFTWSWIPAVTAIIGAIAAFRRRRAGQHDDRNAPTDPNLSAEQLVTSVQPTV